LPFIHQPVFIPPKTRGLLFLRKPLQVLVSVSVFDAEQTSQNQHHGLGPW